LTYVSLYINVSTNVETELYVEIMNEQKIKEKIKYRLNRYFSDIKQISEFNFIDTEEGIDFSVRVKNNVKKKLALVFKIKSKGQPRYVREAVYSLRSKLNQLNTDKQYYGVICAPYLSEDSVRICRGENFGYMDLAGNCFINFEGIYISVEGKPNPYPNKRRLKSILSTKSTRALRVLLNSEKEAWFVKDLAREADISMGLASNIKKRLMEYEYIEERKTETGPEFYLKKPRELLEYWADSYSYKKNDMVNYYTLEDIRKFETEFRNYCNKNNILYAFTLTSGSARVAPTLRYNRGFAYLEKGLEDIENSLNIKKVETGSNFSLLIPYDGGIFNGLQNINGQNVVSNIQLYLDLINYKGRGEEAAHIIYERFIEKNWLKSQIIQGKK